MSILRKSLEEVIVPDLEQICAHQVRETHELEFKKDLPFLRVKGQAEEADRWVTRGDRVGDYARDKILAELIAFANTEGGTLVLGIDETDDEPRRARAISPVPRCQDLAKRLADACEDVIEPRLPLIAARALPLDGDAGIVILRVGRSSIGPHRLASDGQFYTRRGERSVRMTVREVRDLVLEIARRGNAIEELFSARRAVTRNDLQFAWRTATSNGISGHSMAVRVTAFPVSKLSISNLTERPNLWWVGGEYQAAVDQSDLRMGYPARRFAEAPEIALRSFQSGDEQFRRLLTSDGLIEARVIEVRQPAFGKALPEYQTLYLGWLISLVCGVLAQIEHLRRSLANDGAEFAMQVDVEGDAEIALAWDDYGGSGRVALFRDLTFPLLPVGASDGFGDVLNTVLRDVFNHAGSRFRTNVVVDWDALLRH